MATDSELILLINPGSTSTKIAVYSRTCNLLLNEKISHSSDNAFGSYRDGRIVDQLDYRTAVVESVLEEKEIVLSDIVAIGARGGMTHPLNEGGTYRIDQDMLEDLRKARYGDHASNLGALLAKKFSKKIQSNDNLFIVDPISLDERPDESVMPTVEGAEPVQAPWHALNQRYCARKWCGENGRVYEKSNIIVVHAGGGTTVGAHYKGKCVEVNHGFFGGPITTNRSGTQGLETILHLIEMEIPAEEIRARIGKSGGLLYLTGTEDFEEIEKEKNKGVEKYVIAYNMFITSVAKEIMSRFVAFNEEQVDQIIFTGEIARSKGFVNDVMGKIIPHIKYLEDKVTPYGGEFEMEALFEGVTGVLDDPESAKCYGDHKREYCIPYWHPQS